MAAKRTEALPPQRGDPRRGPAAAPTAGQRRTESHPQRTGPDSCGCGPPLIVKRLPPDVRADACAGRDAARPSAGGPTPPPAAASFAAAERGAGLARRRGPPRVCTADRVDSWARSRRPGDSLLDRRPGRQRGRRTRRATARGDRRPNNGWPGRMLPTRARLGVVDSGACCLACSVCPTVRSSPGARCDHKALRHTTWSPMAEPVRSSRSNHRRIHAGHTHTSKN